MIDGRIQKANDSSILWTYDALLLSKPAPFWQADGWIVKRVELLSNPNSKHPTRFWGVYTKLTIFNLVEYERGKRPYLEHAYFGLRKKKRISDAGDT